MRSVALVTALLVASCIDTNLDTCEGLICPNGKRCTMIANQAACELVADCDRKPDGDACDPLTGQRGTCTAGVCIPIAECGNGLIELGEACDCGSGDMIPRSECNAKLNSDTDPLAPCRANCTLRSCGDGVLDASEQCDGSTLQSGTTCGTFGYYAGELTCSPICTFDRSACSRRCDDGVVDPEEQCDGSDFGGTDCAALGYYGGELACNAFCAYDITNCATFGKCNDGVFQVGKEFCDPGSGVPVEGYCTDYGYSAGPLQCSQSCGPGFSDCRSGSVFSDLLPGVTTLVELVGGAHGEAWIAGVHSVYHYVPSQPIDNVDLATDVLDLSSFVDTLHTTVAVSTRDLHVMIYTDTLATPQVIVSPDACTQLVLTSPTRLLCLGSSFLTWWDSGTWGSSIPVMGSAPWDAIADGANVMFTDLFSGIYLVTDTTLTIMPGLSHTVEQITYVPGEGYYGGMTYGDLGGQTYGAVGLQAGIWQILIGTYGLHDKQIVGGRTMWRGDHNIEQADVPPVRPSALGRVAATIDGAGQFACRRFITSNYEGLCLTYGDIHRLLKYAGSTSAQPDPSLVSPGYVVVDAFIDEHDKSYVLSNSGAAASHTSTFPPVGWSPPAGPIYHSMSGRVSNAIVLVGGQAGPGYDLALWTGTWATFHSTTPIGAAYPGYGGKVAVTIGSTTCSIFYDTPASLTAGSATPLISGVTCPSSIWVSPSQTVWTASTSELRDVTHGTVFAVTPSQFSLRASVSGLSDTDLWFVTSGTIRHWDGTAWTVEVDDLDALFDWVSASASGVIASSGGLSRTTWVRTGATWTKAHLPADPTPMIDPILRPWGVYFRTETGTAKWALWTDGWP